MRQFLFLFVARFYFKRKPQIFVGCSMLTYKIRLGVLSTVLHVAWELYICTSDCYLSLVRLNSGILYLFEGFLPWAQSGDDDKYSGVYEACGTGIYICSNDSSRGNKARMTTNISGVNKACGTEVC